MAAEAAILFINNRLLALTSFKTRILLVDYIYTSTATHYAIRTVTTL